LAEAEAAFELAGSQEKSKPEETKEVSDEKKKVKKAKPVGIQLGKGTR
jgi:hypothetical protein